MADFNAIRMDFGGSMQKAEAVRLKPNISKNNDLSILDMGLCPIAPPKGFPIALWKPSGANTFFRFS